MYTALVYLNDVVEGGVTQFDTLGLKVGGPLVANSQTQVTPKRGRAILWPSVLDSNVTHIDARTDHQALPVKRGVKYAINAWMHMYNFRHYYNFACTG